MKSRRDPSVGSALQDLWALDTTGCDAVQRDARRLAAARNEALHQAHAVADL